MKDAALRPDLANRMAQATLAAQDALKTESGPEQLEARLVGIASALELTHNGLAEAVNIAYDNVGSKVSDLAAAQALQGAMSRVGTRAEVRIGQLFKDVMVRDQFTAPAGQVPETSSSGRPDLRTPGGVKISYPAELPREMTRFFVVKPENVAALADALSNSVSRVFRSALTDDGKLPANVYEMEVQGRPVALVSSGDPNFYFGANELKAAAPFGGSLVDLDLRNLDREQRGFFAGSRRTLEDLAAKLR